MIDVVAERIRLVMTEIEAERIEPTREAVEEFIGSALSLPAADRAAIADTVMTQINANDVLTARTAARDRAEKLKAQQLLNARARACRQELTRERAATEGARPTSIEDAARQLYPQLPADELRELVDRASQPIDRGRIVSAIATEVMKDIARRFLKENPGATGSQVWQAVVRHGQPEIKESSFKVFYMPRLREELGLSTVSAPDARRAPTPPRPEPATVAAPSVEERPAPSKAERARRLSQKRAAMEARPNAKGKRPAHPRTRAPARRAAAAEAAAAAAPSKNGHRRFTDMDEIQLQINGERISGKRVDGKWHVNFEGIVDDDVLERLSARVLQGATR